MSSPGTSTPTYVVQPCWVDSNGNIKVNGRSAMTLVLTFQDQSQNPIDVSATSLEFEVEDVLEVPLTPVAGQPSQQQLFLDQDEVAMIGVSPNPQFGPDFVLRDITAGDDLGVVLWEGMIIVRGYTNEPSPVPPPGTIPPQPPITVPPRPPWVSAWVPIAPSGDVPLVSADFVNGNYWNGQSSSTDPSTLFTADASWGPYDPAMIVPGSGLNTDAAPVLLAALAAPLLGGCTVLLRLIIDAPGIGVVCGYNAEAALVLLPSQSVGYFGSIGGNFNGDTGWQSWAGVYNQTDNLTATGPSVGSGPHGLAVNLTFSSLDWAIDGVPQRPSVVPVQPNPLPLPTTIGLRTQSDLTPLGWIESFTVWQRQPAPDLQAISTLEVPVP